MVKKQKGFTLIELLVVIAIIGVLASVVLASLNTARSKGADASIKSNLNGIRSQAELYYDSNSNSYTGGAAGLATTTITAASGVCGSMPGIFTDPNIISALKSAMAQTGDNTKAYCGAGNGTAALGTNGWAVAVPLKSVTTNAWCVDYTGKSGVITVPSAATNFAGC